MKNHYSLFFLTALHISCMQATVTTPHKQSITAIPEHNAAFRKHLPHLYTTLRTQNSSGTHLVELLENIAQKHRSSTTWHLPQDSHHYIGELLQMLDTIIAEQGTNTSKRYTCALSGNGGTLPMLLLTAGLYHIGMQDVALQIIGDESRTALKQLNNTIRNTMLGRNDRFHLRQVQSVDSFIKTSACHVRKPDSIITAKNIDQALLNQSLNGHKPLVFNLSNHTRS